MKKTITKAIKRVGNSKAIRFNKQDNKKYKIEVGERVNVELETKL